MTNRRKTNYAQFDKFQEAIAQGRAERLALPRGLALPLHLRGRAGALLLAAARLSGRSDGRVHDGGREAGVSDGEELRAELHHRLRAPDQPHRPLARAADADGFAGGAGELVKIQTGD